MKTRLVIGPHASMSPALAWAFMAAAGGVSLGIGAVLALKGLWLVLPFAGLEVLALGVALWVSLQRNRYREVVGVVDGRLRIEIGVLGRGIMSVVETPSAWTRVQIVPGANRHRPTRLVLSYCSQRIEIGRCLTDDERERLAVRLQQLLREDGRETPVIADVSAV